MMLSEDDEVKRTTACGVVTNGDYGSPRSTTL